jgi:VIT1/CCC1 family predicted Fe2+/Mn2+ transporter
VENRYDELRDELVAILGAGRELSADTDRQLAEAFLHVMERQLTQQGTEAASEDTPHQPHYSLMLAGSAWGAALMFLFLLLVLDDPNPFAFILVSVVLLSLVALVTRAFLYLARYGWQLPHVRVIAPTRKSQNRR